MSNSINNNIPLLPEGVTDPAAGINEAINVIDALLQVQVLTVGTNTAPGSPADGDRHVVGTAPTGAWSGQAGRLARYLGGGWKFFNAVIAVNLGDSKLYIKVAAGWVAVGV